MWLITTDGFYSVVQKRGEERLSVRARVGADLDRLRERYMPALSKTLETPEGDYRYRAWISRDELAEGLARVARDVTYSNFKDEVGRKDPERERAYHDVWEVLGRLQPGGPYGLGGAGGA